MYFLLVQMLNPQVGNTAGGENAHCPMGKRASERIEFGFALFAVGKHEQRDV